MKKSANPNISQLEIEIESKISNAYLLSKIAAGRHLNFHQLMVQNLAVQLPDTAQSLFVKTKTK